MFPLPLTCIEEYMYSDDSPAYPMTGVFRLRFSGRLDRKVISEALAETVRRHPLLRATVQKRRGRRPRWIDHPDWQPALEWDASMNRFGFPAAGYIDLTQSPGTRVWGVTADDGDQIVLQVHHASTDAIGMNIVIEDLLCGYAARTQGGGFGLFCRTLRPIDLHRLLHRGCPDLTAWKILTMGHKQVYGLLGAWEFLMRTPTALAGPGKATDRTTPPPVFPCPLICELDQVQTRTLLTAAKSLDATVNDLLLRDFFLSVGAWRKQYHIGCDQDWIRFSVAMNLRTPADETMPMANSVSSVFIDRRPTDFADADALLRGIHEEMSLVKRMQLKYTFILSLGVARWIPGGIRREARSNRHPITSWMSNVGPVLVATPLPRLDGRIVCGDVGLQAVDYVIPLRQQMSAAAVVYTYAGRLQLLLSIDPRLIPIERGQRLLEMYRQQIQNTISLDKN
jgi:hypothetical protein